MAQVTSPPPQVAGSWGQGFFAKAWGSVRVKSPVVTHPQDARVLERSLPSGAGALQMSRTASLSSLQASCPLFIFPPFESWRCSFVRGALAAV